MGGVAWRGAVVLDIAVRCRLVAEVGGQRPVLARAVADTRIRPPLWHARELVADQCRVERVARHLRINPRSIGIERSEEHTSELQSLMRISYAVFCLKKKKKQIIKKTNNT